MLSNKVLKFILFQYHPDKIIDSDDETKILFEEILKMINNSYEIALETYGSEQDIQDFTQSQSSEPSDDFTQKYGAEYNSYKYHESEEQYGETSDERHKREQESDREIFGQCLNKEKWQQRGKEHRRQQEEGGEENIELQRDENSYKKMVSYL